VFGFWGKTLNRARTKQIQVFSICRLNPVYDSSNLALTIQLLFEKQNNAYTIKICQKHFIPNGIAENRIT